MPIAWRTDFDTAQLDAEREGRPVLLDFTAAPSDTARALARSYPNSTWAKKASVWLPEAVTSPH